MWAIICFRIRSVCVCLCDCVCLLICKGTLRRERYLCFAKRYVAFDYIHVLYVHISCLCVLRDEISPAIFCSEFLALATDDCRHSAVGRPTQRTAPKTTPHRTAHVQNPYREYLAALYHSPVIVRARLVTKVVVFRVLSCVSCCVCMRERKFFGTHHKYLWLKCWSVNIHIRREPHAFD